MVTNACQNQVKPALVPAVEVKQTIKHELDVVGGVEPIYFPPMKTPFQARMDTGAETSSIDVSKMRSFERDGEKWVAFDLVNTQTKEIHHFEKKIARKAVIRRIAGDEKRIAVSMDVRLGKEVFSADFTLANREKFNYQALIGRNIINGRFIIDSSIENSLN